MKKELNSLVDTAVSVVAKAASSGKVAAPPELVASRIAECEKCPELSDKIIKGVNLGPKCNLCGCLMKTKTRLLAAKCPLKKW